MTETETEVEIRDRDKMVKLERERETEERKQGEALLFVLLSCPFFLTIVFTRKDDGRLALTADGDWVNATSNPGGLFRTKTKEHVQ